MDSMRMQSKPAEFKENLSWALQWKNYKVLLIANSLIAVLLSIFYFSPELKVLLKNIARHFILAQSIGHSIYFFASSFNFKKIKNNWLKLLGLTIIFMVGGWIGSIPGLGIIALLLNSSFSLHYLKSFLLNITIFNILAASVVYSYFTLRSKFQQTVARLAEKEINEQRLLRLKTRADLEALRAKVNPHFLFNTLNSISSLIPVEPAKAEEMVQKLSHLFRYTLDASKQEFIKLGEEVKIIEEYLEIEKVRLGERLSYSIELDNKLKDTAIPGLLLQPLVENSVQHGIAAVKAGGHIQMRCTSNNNYCEIAICDNGKGFDSLENGNGFGLSGVKERLDLYYGEDYEFQISNNNGVQILLRIPNQSRDNKI